MFENEDFVVIVNVGFVEIFDFDNWIWLEFDVLCIDLEINLLFEDYFVE